MLGRVGLAVGYRVAGAALLFVFNFYLAHTLGASRAGVFFLAFSLTAFLSGISRQGMDGIVLREVARGQASTGTGATFSILRSGRKLALLTSVLLAFLVELLAPWAAVSLFESPGLAPALHIMALGIPLHALLILHVEALKGRGEVLRALAVFQVLFPALLLFSGLVLIGRFAVIGACISFVLAAATGLFTAWRIWARSGRRAEPTHDPAGWTCLGLHRAARPLMIVYASEQLQMWLPTLLLGVWYPDSAVGVYGMATRFAQLMTFSLNAVNALVAARLAQLWAGGQHGQLALLGRRSLLAALLFATPLGVLLLAVPGFFLGTVGQEYTAGSLALRILVAAQLVNVGTGPVRNLLVMAGREVYLRSIEYLAGGAFLVLTPLLIYTLGVSGAAIATGLTVVLKNLLALYVCRRTTGLDLIRGTSRGYSDDI